MGRFEIIRRWAAMAPLWCDETFRVLEVCDRLVRKAQQIVLLRADLPTSFGAVNNTLNELQRILGGMSMRPGGQGSSLEPARSGTD